MLWRLLRIGSAPYFVLGAASATASLRLRVMTAVGLAPGLRAEALRRLGRRRRPAPGALAGPGPGPGRRRRSEPSTATWRCAGATAASASRPEAKVYLDTPHHRVPGLRAPSPDLGTPGRDRGLSYAAAWQGGTTIGSATSSPTRRAAADRGDWDAGPRPRRRRAGARPGRRRTPSDLLERADAAAPDRGGAPPAHGDVLRRRGLHRAQPGARPELVREVLRSYQVTCDRVVRRYEGRIARYIGDGVLAYFGHPVAHEDDARRGVKAGLDLLEALRPVDEEVRERYDIDLRIRVAVHTGLVVRADMGSAATPDRDAIVGETPERRRPPPGPRRARARSSSATTPTSSCGAGSSWPRSGAVALKGIDQPVAGVPGGRGGDRGRPGAGPGRPQPVRRAGRGAAPCSRTPGTEVARRRLARASRVTGPARRRQVPPGRRAPPAGRGRRGHRRSSPLLQLPRAHRAAPGPAAARAGGGDRRPPGPRARAAAAVERDGRRRPGRGAAARGRPARAPARPRGAPRPSSTAPSSASELLATLVGLGPGCGRPRTRSCSSSTTSSGPTPPPWSCSAGSSTRRSPGCCWSCTVRDDAKVPVVRRHASSRSTACPPTSWPSSPAGSPRAGGSSPPPRPAPSSAATASRSSSRSSLRSSAPRPRRRRAARAPTIPAALRDLLLARFAAPGVDLRLAQLLATIGPEAPLPLAGRSRLDLADDELDAAARRARRRRDPHAASRATRSPTGSATTCSPTSPTTPSCRRARQAAHAEVADALLARARRRPVAAAPPCSPTTSSRPAARPRPCWRCSRPPRTAHGARRQRRGDGAARARVRPPRTGRARAAPRARVRGPPAARPSTRRRSWATPPRRRSRTSRPASA